MSAADAKRLKNLLSANILGLRIPKGEKTNRNVILKQLVKNQQVVDSMNKAIELVQEACPSTSRWNKGDSGIDDLWYVLTNYNKQPDNFKGAVTSFLNVLFESPSFKESSLTTMESQIRSRLGILKAPPPRTAMPTQGGQAYFTQPTPSEAKTHHDTQKGGSAYVPSNLNVEDGKGHMVPETNPDAFMLPEIAPETTSIQNASTDLSTAEPKKQDTFKTTTAAPTSTADTRHMRKAPMSATPGYRMPPGDTRKTDGSAPGTTQLQPENKQFQRAYGDSKAQAEVAASIMNETTQGESTSAGHQQLAPHTYETTGMGTGRIGTMGATPDVGTTPGASMTTASSRETPRPTETPSGASSGSTIYGGRLKPQPNTMHAGGMRKEQLPPGASIRDDTPAGSFAAFTSFMHLESPDWSGSGFNWNEVMEMGEWALGVVGALNGVPFGSAAPGALKKALTAALAPLGGTNVLSSNKLIAALAKGDKPDTLKKLINFFSTLYNSYSGTPESASDSPGWVAAASDWITKNRGAQGAFGRVINEYENLRREAMRDAPANVNSGIQALNDILNDDPVPLAAPTRAPRSTTARPERSIGPSTTYRPEASDNPEDLPVHGGSRASMARKSHMGGDSLVPDGFRGRRLLGVGDSEEEDATPSPPGMPPKPDPLGVVISPRRVVGPPTYDLSSALKRRRDEADKKRYAMYGPKGGGRDSFFRQLVYSNDDPAHPGVEPRFDINKKTGEVIDNLTHEHINNGKELREFMYAEISYENELRRLGAIPVFSDKARNQAFHVAYALDDAGTEDSIQAQRRMVDFYADDKKHPDAVLNAAIIPLIVKNGLDTIRAGDRKSVGEYMIREYKTWDDIIDVKGEAETPSRGRNEPDYMASVGGWDAARGVGPVIPRPAGPPPAGAGAVPIIPPFGAGRGAAGGGRGVPPAGGGRGGAPPAIPVPGALPPVGGKVPAGPVPMAGPVPAGPRGPAPGDDPDDEQWLLPVTAYLGVPPQGATFAKAGGPDFEGKYYDDKRNEIKRPVPGHFYDEGHEVPQVEYEEKYGSMRDISAGRSAYVSNTGGPQSSGRDTDNNGIENYYVPQLRLSFREGDADIVTRVNQNPVAISADRKMWQEFRGYHYEANQEPDNPLHAGVILDEARRFYEPLDKEDILMGQAEAAIQESYDCQMTAFTYPEEFKVYGDPFVLDTRGGGPLEPLDAESTYAQFHDVYWGQEGLIPNSSPWNQFTQSDGSQLADSALHGNTVFAGNDLPLLSIENAFIFTTAS